MKKLCKSLTAILVSLTITFTLWPAVALAAGETGVTADNLKWVVLPGDASLRITDYNGAVPAGTTITIPAAIDTGLGYGVLPVTEVGELAFSEDNNITGLDLSGATNLKTIGDNAFRYCHMATLNIPGTITSLGVGAFKGCDHLTDVTMHNGTTNLGKQTFMNCSLLSSVTLPGDLSVIPESMFSDCTALEHITIPASVTSIGQWAFTRTGLHGITIPDTVTSINGNTFLDCQEIGTESVTLSSGCSTIPGGMFHGCPELHAITIPGTVTIIGVGAFEESGLSSITIPESVQNINSDVFGRCTGLSAIGVDAASTHYTSVDGVLYNAGKTILVCYPAGKAGADFSVPGGVQEIFWYAFDGSVNLTRLALPESVTAIDNGAFSHCGNLSLLYVHNAAAAFGDDLFTAGTVFTTAGRVYGHAGSTAETYAASINAGFEELLELTPSPADCKIYTGGRITITPNVAGGGWNFSTDYLSRDGNEFTGLKAGTVRVTYFTGDENQAAYVDVIVRQSELPSTGQDFSFALWLLAAGALAGGAAFALFMKRRRLKRAR